MMIVSLALTICAFCSGLVSTSTAEHHEPYSTWMLESIISRGEGIVAADGLLSGIQKGIFQEALRAAIARSRDSSQQARWTDYHQRSLNYKLSDFSNATANALAPLDRLCTGVSIMQTNTSNQVSTSVIDALRKSLDLQETNANGGWWYFANPPPPYIPYGNLSFSDGMYGVAPFAVLYGQRYPFDTGINISTALTQLEALYTHVHYRGNLLLHGYDASKTAPWANPVTGASPIVWGRSMSWYMIGILDALEIAAQDPSTRQSSEYRRMKAIFNELACGNIAALWQSAQVTSKYGVWQVVDRPGEEDNFIEASASAMIAYALGKGIRLGYIDPLLRPDRTPCTHGNTTRYTVSAKRHETPCSARDVIQRLYDEVVRSFVVRTANGTLEFHGTSALSSLEVEDPDYEYYTHRPRANDSLIGESAFVLASLENEYSKSRFRQPS